MPQLPILSGQEIISALERAGYRETHQRGSHRRLASLSPNTSYPLSEVEGLPKS